MSKENFDPAMINLFKQEAGKHILKVSNIMLAMEKEGVNKEKFTEMKREVHTLKGDSRMLGFIKISDASHKLEDLFLELGKEEKKIDKELIEIIFKSLDAIQNAIDKLPDEEIDIKISFSKDEEKKVKKDDKVILFDDTAEKMKISKIELFEVNSDEKKGKKIKEIISDEIKEKQQSEKEFDYINIKLKKIDEMLNLFSAFPRYSSRFNFILNQLKEIKDAIRDKYYDDEITKSLDLLIYDFSHEITFFDLSTKQFQNDLTRIKLVPLATIFDLFPRLVRDIASNTNKKINFIMKGKEVELDKSVVEKLKEVLIHMINNSVDHGCELPEIRQKSGKPVEGNITLSAFNKGDNIVIEISDDGQGIDIEKVKSKAIERGLISKEKAENLTNDDIISFIFEAGFSTKDVSKFSGRGIGMNVVVETIKDLNGEIKVNTWKNKGTTFVITLPLISFFIPVTVFEIGSRLIGIPSSYITQVLRKKINDIKKMGDIQGLINIKNMEITVIDIAQLLGFDNIYKESEEKSKNIIILKYLDEITGISVSNIVIEKKMIIKKITALNEKFKIIIGAVLTGSERAIPVLNVPEIFKLLKEDYHALTKLKKSEISERKIWAKNILLVEDSLVTRDHEKKILLNQNLNVFEASNGKEALNLLKNQNFDIIITDIEMPVMDGLELIKNIKKIEKYNTIPIIVVSSYKDYQSKLNELGIKHFLNKTEFSSSGLLNILKRENIII